MYANDLLQTRFGDAVQSDWSGTGIVELDVNELEMVDGGIAPLVIIAVAAVVIIGAAFLAGVVDGASGQPHQ